MVALDPQPVMTDGHGRGGPLNPKILHSSVTPSQKCLLLSKFELIVA